jgi:hypothetical protein
MARYKAHYTEVHEDAENIRYKTRRPDLIFIHFWVGVPFWLLKSKSINCLLFVLQKKIETILIFTQVLQYSCKVTQVKLMMLDTLTYDDIKSV